MKATINGIAVEGTPQEIVSYLKLLDDLRRNGTYIKPALGEIPNWLKSQINTSGSLAGYAFVDNVNYAKGKCPNDGPCYCTGACK